MYYIPPAAQGPQPGAQPTASVSMADARTCAAGLKAAGAGDVEILDKLRDMGLADEVALAMLDEVDPPNSKKSKRRRQRRLAADRQADVHDEITQALIQANKEAGRNNMLVGAAVFVIGLVVTLGTMAAAQGGGTIVIAWGAIIFGAAQFVRGMAQAGGSTSH
jgi:hypothetical protein